MLHEIYDENEHSKESYAYFGLAVFYSQVLEHQLVNMIVLLKRSQGLLPTEGDFDALYERKFSNTMGQLINEIKQLYPIKPEELNELKEILKLRNFIVHDFFKEKINLTFTRNGRDQLIIECKEFVERVRTLDSQLVIYSKEILEKLGITEEILENEVKEIKEEERLKELENS
ncbi:hypothetical protein ACN6KS_26930 [Paenibacillus nitricinens]|uniref:hypothetical protein n=1 Tax=Paenibacillus nitricinens TaxID=3367691 RepID=UPI003F842BCD